MNNKNLLDAFGSIDDTLVHNAVNDSFKKQKSVWGKWLAIVACGALVLMIGIQQLVGVFPVLTPHLKECIKLEHRGRPINLHFA